MNNPKLNSVNIQNRKSESPRLFILRRSSGTSMVVSHGERLQQGSQLSTLNDIDDGSYNVLGAKLGVDHQLIKMRVLPIAPKISPNILGTHGISRANQFLNIPVRSHADP